MAEQRGDERDGQQPSKHGKVVVIAGFSLGSIVALAFAFASYGSFEGLSELLTMAYQAGWLALLVHFGAHVRAGYQRRAALPRETALELLFVVAWGTAAVGLGTLGDPKLLPLLAVWASSMVTLFALGTTFERARVRHHERTGTWLPRSSQVLKESCGWTRLMGRIKQTDDPPVEETFEKIFPEDDTEDGKLTRMHWNVVRAMAVVVLITATTASAEKLVKEESPPPGSGKSEESGGNGSDGDPNATVTARRRAEGEAQEAEAEAEGEDCEGERDPSGRMPSSIRRSLSLAWHDVEGLVPDSMEALDYDIGGCPGPAQRIPGLKGAWYAPGYCDGDLTMLSIAFAGVDHPVVLLEQAADFAQPIIHEGRFLSAEDRFTVGEGDAYVIHTRDGSYVPIRDTASHGPVEGSRDDGGSCGEFADEDVAYSVAGPGLLDPWRSAAAMSPGGVYPIDVATDDPSRPRIALRSTATGILTTAACDADLLTCEVIFGGRPYTGHPGGEITPEEVKALAEG